jgi:hypothetical protein
MIALRRIVIMGAAAALLGAAIVGTACGGGGDEADQVTPTVATSLLRPTPDTNTPLIEYRSPDKGYVVSYPEGWEFDDSPQALGDAFVWRMADGTNVAQLVITRNADILTPEDLLKQDVSIISTYGGRIDPTQTRDVQVAGKTGTMALYATSLGGLPAEQAVVYFAGDDYGWRLGLTTYGGSSLPAFLPLFDRIIASFQFTG